MAFMSLDESNHIVSFSNTYHCGDSDIEILSVPANVNLDNILDYIYQNGQFIYSPKEIIQPQNEITKLQQQINDLKQQNELLTNCILEISEAIYGDDQIQ